MYEYRNKQSMKIVHKCSQSLLCWCTFGTNYSFKSFWIWCHKRPLWSTSQAPSGWMESVDAQPFSDLSRDESSQSWATQGHPPSCPEATPLISWLRAQGRYASRRSRAALVNVSVHCWIFFLTILTTLSVPPSGKHPHSMVLPQLCLTGSSLLMSGTGFPLNMRAGIRSLWAHSGLAALPYGPDWCIAAEVVALLEGSPLFTEEIHRVLGHLPD